ncbi:D-alanyl-D-alanine carboxypeptidase [Thermodesulfobacterium sp. TA1]|nr:D-alanyl-D-alanine carboxypeptidase [Thermodesulfobacterium sp. TA1]
MMKQTIKKFLGLLFFFCIILWGQRGIAEDLNNLTEISAVTAVTLDATTGKVLFAKNPNLKIPPASTVKLITAMVVLDKLPLNKKVVISKTAAETPSVAPLLKEGEVYTVNNLLYLLLMKSSNQAAVALAEEVAGSEEKFALYMNQKAKELGLNNSYFISASGLPSPGQYTTAYDLALILYQALKYPLIKEIIGTHTKIISSEGGRVLVVKNTNHLLEDPELKDYILGGKTGFTRASKHCLVTASKVHNRLIITSVLGAPSRESLWRDSKELIKFSQLVLENKAEPLYLNTVVTSQVPISHVSKTKLFKANSVVKASSKKSKTLVQKSSKKSKAIASTSKTSKKAKTLTANKTKNNKNKALATKTSKNHKKRS